MTYHDQGYFSLNPPFPKTANRSQNELAYRYPEAGIGEVSNLTLRRFFSSPVAPPHSPSLVSEQAYGYELPPEDAYARRLAKQAEEWLAFAAERSRMRPATLTRKALDALAFSFRHRANDLAVPSKLVGTKAHQRALWTLVGERPDTGLALGTNAHSGPSKALSVDVSWRGLPLGRVQQKHVTWLAPLLAFGATVHLVRVTGEDHRTLGANVCFARVDPAIERLSLALGGDRPQVKVEGFPGGDSLPGPGTLNALDL